MLAEFHDSVTVNSIVLAGEARRFQVRLAPRKWVAWALIALTPDGLWVEGGWLRSSSDQVARYREHGDARLEAIVDDLESTGYELLGERLKRAPSRLLAYRSLVAGRSLGDEPWLRTRVAVERVRDEWRALRPLVEWLAANVGPRVR